MTLGKGLEQLGVFAVFAVLGVVFACIYIFGYGLFKGIFGVIFDILFGLANLICIVLVNLATNNGEFRVFIFFGIAIGAIIAYFVCKSPLDKASNALYNLFTIKLADKNDGKIFLHEKEVGAGCGDDTAAGVADMHVAGNAHAVAVDKPKGVGIKSNNRKTFARQRRSRRSKGVQRNGRLRHRMGNSKRANKP